MAKIEIYTAMMCGYCYQAKALLAKKKVEFKEIHVGFHPRARAEMIQRSKGRRTVPQIFINDAHIGGYDDLYTLDSAGKLDQILESV
ncbi:MAG: glutaredoxin 3 [Sphingomonadales bacterium]